VDPNQAYVDSNQAYVDPNQAYVDPNQAYVDPNQAYVDPNQAYADPNQAYVDPNQAYVDPNQAYVDPNQAYVDPNQAYVDPNQAYVDPNQAYVDPNQAYVDPNQPAEIAPPAISQGAGVYDDAPVEPAPAPAAAAPGRRRPKAKKKVVKRGPQRRPATPRSRSTYKRPAKRYGEGFSLMTVFVSLAILGLIALIGMLMAPKDLSFISGYPAKEETMGVPRNILDEAQRLMVSRGGEIALSETDLNTYLNQRLKGEQGGIISSFVDFKGVYVDIAPGTAEIFIERELFGFPITMSSKVKSEKNRGQTTYQPEGWTLGKIETKTRIMKPVKELFLSLRSTCIDEYTVLQQLSDVRFEDDKLVLSTSI
ncbi:MAG: hypothetical protein P1U68_08205, partial [Verrucomicrobiales bacterium]|nr:hypothetical protein [Verrucomicrobiales bacterium]